MTRIPYPDPSKQSAVVRATLERAPINIMKMVSHASEPVFTGFGQFSGAFYQPSDLEPLLREVAILRVGYLSKSAYEVYHHEAMGRQIGLTDAQIDAIRAGRPDPVLTPAQQAVMAFADDVVLNVRAGDVTLATVRGFLSDRALVDLILVIGLYMTVSRLLETTGVGLDRAPINTDLTGLSAG
ncbi:MAG: carboxymuconolactone decarboxylase family protein [Rhodospirillales bacterium]|nr:carboxymuconolactone decarboxylase family protein [Rhodospirillales bacterium]